MNLNDVVDNIGNYADALAIYAAPRPRWAASSRAVVLTEPADGSLPPAATGLTYLMEVARAKEVLTVWRRCRPGVDPSTDELCEAIIYYARPDAHEPIFEDAV